MAATLHAKPSTWQGLGIRKCYDLEERPLSQAASLVAEVLLQVGKQAPATVLLAAMERRGHDDPGALLLEAYWDAPYAFAFYRL